MDIYGLEVYEPVAVVGVSGLCGEGSATLISRMSARSYTCLRGCFRLIRLRALRCSARSWLHWPSVAGSTQPYTPQL